MNITIAGATRNIGKTIARALASKHRLLLTYREEERKKWLGSKHQSSFKLSKFILQKNFF